MPPIGVSEDGPGSQAKLSPLNAGNVSGDGYI